MVLQVSVMTPDGIFWDNKAEEVILPTNTGQMGVLANHAPLITALDVGVTLIRTDKKWTPLAVMGGFALVKQNQITILVNGAESADTLQSEKVEASFEEAKNQLENAESEKQRVDALFQFKRARARYQVIKQLVN
ncbi:atpE (chloroplast) [Auxenochlorella protothecoides x Auxenochlorella symbiontica]|uniref:ATP synthase epsilon chain, chloroplastic n=1 Tax=Auxenochlorella protothecoides TaxID=3075 RepID=A0A023HHY7_AUXPR|nr:CF1 epsilon subunit of ATP synthase [Auxenochlorella protothecoides]AGL10851.1 CF1 epsilon subunit of ATP synthase [Auxenochlorella protothecoides]AGN72493.1 ATP synthase CF1 epsilon subunit [Auxenochlorella protothecoides]ARU77474.1 ATP synthase epsilon chain [Auxenochlorella protothecoides]